MLLDQLPDVCKIALYTDFIFKDFLWKFRRTFRFYKNHFQEFTIFRKVRGQVRVENPKKFMQYPYYTFDDNIYAQFMLNFMNLLEVRSFKKGELIANEMDEALELLFVERGIYEVGFEINKKVFYER
jgi:hypothetical protein